MLDSRAYALREGDAMRIGLIIATLLITLLSLGAWRGWSRGGGGKRGRGATGGRRGGGNGGRRGQIRNGKVVPYAVENKRGKTVYIGSTNNPRRRVVEHRQSGKMRKGDKLVPLSRPTSRRSAERIESARIGAHKRRNGAIPQRNRTGDGRFHKHR